METTVFVLISLLTLGGAAIAVLHRSIVHSAFALMATLFGMAGYYVLLGADFLAVVQVLLYVGGILVLILFGLMLTKPDLRERSLVRLGLSLLVVATAAIWIGARVSSSVQWYERAAAEPLVEGEVAAETSSIRETGIAFLSQDQFVVPFELASVLLLVALIGAVMIARRRGPEEELGEGEEV